MFIELLPFTQDVARGTVNAPPLKGELVVVDLGAGITMKMALIRPGGFDMGSPRNETDREQSETRHRVQIRKPYFMEIVPVTQVQWKAVTQTNPSSFVGDDLPVDSVSWTDAVTFCKNLSAREGMVLRLPTEAEWEYACRAGTSTPYSFGEDSTELRNHAWFSENSGGSTHSVGTKQPNAWGLYDMEGNVWQWCSDFGGDYSERELIDPMGPPNGDTHVLRGGSWGDVAKACRAACRFGATPGYVGHNIGFRVVLDASEPNIGMTDAGKGTNSQTAPVLPGVSDMDRVVRLKNALIAAHLEVVRFKAAAKQRIETTAEYRQALADLTDAQQEAGGTNGSPTDAAANKLKTKTRLRELNDGADTDPDVREAIQKEEIIEDALSSAVDVIALQSEVSQLQSAIEATHNEIAAIAAANGQIVQGPHVRQYAQPPDYDPVARPSIESEIERGGALRNDPANKKRERVAIAMEHFEEALAELKNTQASVHDTTNVNEEKQRQRLIEDEQIRVEKAQAELNEAETE
jgi:formylglycine-generating enzyme required for sulfatase activity